MIEEPKKKPSTQILDSDTGLKVKINVCISVSYVPGLSEEFYKNLWTYQCTSHLQGNQQPEIKLYES